MVVRLVGCMMLLVGAMLGYIGLVIPLDQVHAHAPSVDYSFKAIVMTPFALVIGALCLVFGGDMKKMKAEPARFRMMKIFVSITAGVAGVGGFLLAFWFRSYLSDQGYRF